MTVAPHAYCRNTNTNKSLGATGSTQQQKLFKLSTWFLHPNVHRLVTHLSPSKLDTYGDVLYRLWRYTMCQCHLLSQVGVSETGSSSRLRQNIRVKSFELSWAVTQRSFISFNYIILILSIYNTQNNEVFVYISSVGGVASSLTELCVWGGGGRIKTLQLVLLCSLSSARRQVSLSCFPSWTGWRFIIVATIHSK